MDELGDPIGYQVLGKGVPVVVADTVGAGDTFSAVLIDALLGLGVGGSGSADALAVLSDAAVHTAVRTAAAGAAVTVSRPGADPPDRGELTEAVARQAGAAGE